MECKIKAVIFDMDGVLIDSEPIHNQINDIVFRELELEITETEYESFVGTSNKDMWTILKEKYNLSQPLEDLMKYHNEKAYDYFSKNNIELIEGVLDLLTELNAKGYKIGLASSSPIELITIIQKKSKIKSFFMQSVSGEIFEKSKPNPEIFLYTANALGVPPEECVVIEDSKNGVTAAKRAKMKCIGYRNLNSGNQDLSMADVVVDSIREIESKLIESL